MAKRRIVIDKARQDALFGENPVTLLDLPTEPDIEHQPVVTNEPEKPSELPILDGGEKMVPWILPQKALG